MHNKNITPYNDNGNQHGYWESYYSNGQLAYKGHYNDGNRHGYWETYWSDGKLISKGNFKHDNKIGFWIQNNKQIFYAQ